MFELEFRSETGNGSVEDPALVEAPGRIGAVGAVGRGADLPSRSLGVEGHRMEIDLPAIDCSHHDPNGGMVLGQAEAQSLERFQHGREGHELDHEIDIVVRPSLFPQERIHPPTAVHPDLQVLCFEDIENVDDVTGPHTHVKKVNKNIWVA
jgi:hypothetical protein